MQRTNHIKDSLSLSPSVSPCFSQTISLLVGQSILLSVYPSISPHIRQSSSSLVSQSVRSLVILLARLSFNQSVSQLVYVQSFNQFVCLPVHKPVSTSVFQLFWCLVSHPVSQLLGPSTSPSFNQFDCMSIRTLVRCSICSPSNSHTAILFVSQLACQFARVSVRQFVNQSVSWPVNQSFQTMCFLFYILHLSYSDDLSTCRP